VVPGAGPWPRLSDDSVLQLVRDDRAAGSLERALAGDAGQRAGSRVPHDSPRADRRSAVVKPGRFHQKAAGAAADRAHDALEAHEPCGPVRRIGHYPIDESFADDPAFEPLDSADTCHPELSLGVADGLFVTARDREAAADLVHASPPVRQVREAAVI